MRKQKEIGVAELCRRVGITRWRLNYLQDSGYIEKPEKNFAGHRVYSDEDVEKIIEVNRQLSVKRDKLRPLGVGN